MNLSRRAKLDREADARGDSRKKKPAAESAPAIAEQPGPDPAPPPPAEPVAPISVPDMPPPKMPRFVRPKVEKRAATTARPLAEKSTKQAGKMMSKSFVTTQIAATTGQKGPKLGRVPIVNTRKRK